MPDIPLLMPGQYIRIAPRQSCSLPRDWRWYPHDWCIVTNTAGYFVVFDPAAIGTVLRMSAPCQMELPLSA